jgi:nucleoside-diphosphate-sugar epimerase
MKALVIGGTGPTGPHLVAGMLERGYEVTLLHRGLHEDPSLPAVEHIHADPYQTDSLLQAVQSLHFDVVLGMYGRVKAIGEAFSDRCEQLICVSGTPVYRGLIAPETSTPSGMALLAREDGPLVDELADPPRFAAAIRSGEQFVLDRGRAGAYRIAGVRYPQIYGPRNVIPWEWPIVRRVLDKRERMIVPDDGLWIVTRCAARNAAEVVLKLVDNPDVANGKYYNAADDDQFTVRQLAELVIARVGGDTRLVGIPSALSPSGFGEYVPPGGRPHMLVDNNRAKLELGYREVIGAREALFASVDWMLENPIDLNGYPAYSPWFDYDMEDRILNAWDQLSQQMIAQTSGI